MIRGGHDAEPTAPRRPGAVTPLLWAGGGFVAGAVFWHLVGFWSLVSMAVLGSDQASRATPGAVTTSAPAAKSRRIETGSVTTRKAPCVALELNRLLGETRPLPCRAETFHHVNAGLGTKDDRAAGAPAWSTTLR